jgi:uncharacterized protein YfaS (alpha-2-macroglobulin family)
VDGKAAQGLNFQTPLARVPLTVSGEQVQLSLENTSSAYVYARVFVQGLPAEGAEPALAEGLSLDVAYYNVSGSRMDDPSGLPLGDDMDIRVTVKNTSAFTVPEIALVHMLPASWEIINTRLGDQSSSRAPAYKYQDIRDDRVMTYFDLSRGQSKTVSFRVNRTYGGNFFHPAVYAYAMYNESIRAVVPGQRYTGNEK